MIGLTFHSPEKVLEQISIKHFRPVVVLSDEDLPLISKSLRVDDTRQKILLIREFERLHSYVESDELRQFKIFIFDCPKNFFKHRFVFADAVPRGNGTWTRKSISVPLMNEWFKDMTVGLDVETDLELEAQPWGYDQEL